MTDKREARASEGVTEIQRILSSRTCEGNDCSDLGCLECGLFRAWSVEWMSLESLYLLCPAFSSV